MKALSLCSGVGMLDLAMQWAWMEIVGQVEIDPWCRAVLAKNFPNVKRMTDIKEVQGNEFGAIDIVAGGIPCQPFSKSGELLGTADPRHLWPEARRIIATAQPTWVVIENVDHFLPMVLDLVQTDLENQGYEVWAAILPACAVAAPHIRKRACIVAHTNGERIHARKHDGGHEAQIPIIDHAHEDVANPVSQRRQRNTQARWQAGSGTQYTGDVEYTDSTRWQRLFTAAIKGESQSGFTSRPTQERLQQLFESCMGGNADGRSGGMDRVTRWPAYQGEAQHDYEPPRTIPQRVKDHAKRLHAIGNGVVPQMFYPIFAGIMLIEQHITR